MTGQGDDIAVQMGHPHEIEAFEHSLCGEVKVISGAVEKLAHASPRLDCAFVVLVFVLEENHGAMFPDESGCALEDVPLEALGVDLQNGNPDRKSTRLNSSHSS